LRLRKPRISNATNRMRMISATASFYRNSRA
jgi:hypothetical protein